MSTVVSCRQHREIRVPSAGKQKSRVAKLQIGLPLCPVVMRLCCWGPVCFVELANATELGYSQRSHFGVNNVGAHLATCISSRGQPTNRSPVECGITAAGFNASTGPWIDNVFHRMYSHFRERQCNEDPLSALQFGD